MYAFPSLSRIETMFNEMEPTNVAGEPLIPSLHPEEIRLDDTPEEQEDDQELEAFNAADIGPFTAFPPSETPVPLVAMDAGVLDIGISRTGFALAFKAAIVAQDCDGIHTLAKIGPRVKFITPENQGELLRFVGRELLNENMFVEERADGTLQIKSGSREPNQYKDRIRNFIERMLQLDVARQLQNGVMLVDGALTLRTYNTPQTFLEELAREVASHNSDIVGVSKKSRLTVQGVYLASLLDGDPPDAGFRRIYKVDEETGLVDAASRNLGIPFAARFAPGGFTFRVDVARRSLLPDEDAVLGAIFSNTQMTLGYPNLLRLAHIHSAFTKAEVVALQVQTAHDYRVEMQKPEDLSVIFAPFRKGLGE